MLKVFKNQFGNNPLLNVGECLFTLLILVSVAQSADLPAFPGAEGFGSKTVGGSGRHLTPAKTEIFKISNLKDSGIGSLRECVEATIPRVCVFETSGSILLKKSLKINSPYLTIAGQTAPSPGILIRGAGFEINTNDVIIQHLEVRPGGELPGTNPASRDGVGVIGNNSAYNVVIDHLSISWAVDENASTGQAGTHDVTWSNCIISEALRNSVHPKGTHSMGLLIGDGSKNISVHSNLFAHNFERNPRLKSGVSAEVINNVVYHWGGHSGWSMLNISAVDDGESPTLVNAIGNFYKAGPESPVAAGVYARPVVAGTRVYVAHNISPFRPNDIGDEWAFVGLPKEPHQSLVPTFPPSGIIAHSPTDNWDKVLKNAGSRPAQRNETDIRVIEEARKGTGSFKDCIAGCDFAVGAWPKRKEVHIELILPKNPNQDDDKDGYTNLEEFLHKLGSEVGG